MKRVILLVVVMLSAVLISGCVTVETAADLADKTACELGGGTWINDIGECCPKGCPAIMPGDVSEQLRERCEMCWK